MKQQINKVKKFHKSFGVENGIEPRNLDMDGVSLRCKLLDEELKEYEVAAYEGDLVEIADALCDQLYIVFGTILRHGMQDIIGEVFNEVQRSNMSKLDKRGNPIINGIDKLDPTRPNGKILKSDEYFEPNIKKILEPWL